MPANPAVLKPEEASLLGNVLETVGSELARAETSERDLFVVLARYLQDQKIQTIPQAVGLFGANLVLTAAVRRAENSIHLTLRLMDAALSKALRSSTVSCAAAALFTLPELAANRAAALLDISRKDWSSRGAQGGTNNGEAYAAYLRGKELLKSHELNDAQQAAIELQKSIELDPRFALAFAALAEAYSDQYVLTHDSEAFELADRNSQKAIDLGPGVPACRRSRAVIEMTRGEYDSAISDLRKAIELDPEAPDAQLFLAQTYADIGRLQDSDRTYERLLKDRPNYWLALSSWGVDKWRRADYARAEQLLRQATIATPGAAMPWRNLGGVYLSTNRFDKAEQALQRSLRLLPTGSAYTNLGTAQFWQGEYEKAALNYEKAVDLSPSRYENWRNLGDCRQQLGKHGDAVAAWTKAEELAEDRLRVNSKNADTMADLSLLKAKLGRRKAARDLLDRVNALGKPNPNRLFVEAEAYELAGQREMALQVLRQCIAADYSRFEILHAPELQELRKDERFKALGLQAA
jgi:tetratricopeptide (TPR) repeat protein